jgi:hypothetical protein
MSDRRISRPRMPDADAPTGPGDVRWHDRRRRLAHVQKPPPPRLLIRNDYFEQRLSRLAADSPVVWVCAPAGSGKRTAVSAWLDHVTPPGSRAHWLRVSEALIEGAPVAPPVLDFLVAADAAGPGAAHPTPDDGVRSAPHTLVVLEMGGRRLTAEDLTELEATMRERPGWCLIVLTDGWPTLPPGYV